MKHPAHDSLASQATTSQATDYHRATMLGRRSFLRLAFTGVAATAIGAATSACGTTSPTRAPRVGALRG